jgi:DNA-binding NarL/FixJ family response regulator
LRCRAPNKKQEWSSDLSLIRILLVDDFENWRRQVRSILQARPDWQVIEEASDGPEAVQKAEELTPDLIVLDVGLPNLNGIEAARQIRQRSPDSEIVFLSENSGLDVVRAAFDTGALGFVRKTDAGFDLLPAIDAVLRHKQFVSSSFKGQESAEDLKGHRFSASPEVETAHSHEVLFYSDDTVLLDRVSHFIAGALRAGDAAIVLATKSHRDGLLQRLKEGGVDTDGALRQGSYISLDARDSLSAIMVNGLPDSVQFFERIGGSIEAAAKAVKSEEPRIVVFGEAVALLQAEGNADAAICFEQLGNDLPKTHKVDILCAYSLSNFRNEEDEHVFKSICAQHSAVYSQ